MVTAPTCMWECAPSWARKEASVAVSLSPCACAMGEAYPRSIRRAMAWDFSTEPEFQAQLDWMTAFVRDEIWPLESIFSELSEDGFRRAIVPLKDQVRERGLWAAHLPPDLGGQGFGQVKLGLMHEILGT